MPLAYRETSAPIIEPVTLARAKKQLVIDANFTDDDDLIQTYIVAARQMVEKMMNRSIFNRKMRISLDYFPWPGWQTVTGSSHDAYLGWYFRSLSIRLPKPATFSVDSISYIGTDLQTHTLDPSTYVVDLLSEPARISPAPGYTWPYQQNYIPGQVIIEFTSGTYGDGIKVNNCPQSIVMAILLLVSHFYAHREASSETALKTIPLGVAELIAGETFESFS
jgi:uncharacterized phiE125 gp8 family phage protein